MEKPGKGAVSSKDIATIIGISPRYLEPLMQQLVHHRILRSIRGPHGGYVLAKERHKLTLASLWEILEDEEDSKEHAPNKMIEAMHTQILVPLFSRINQELLSSLQHITLEQLCLDADRIVQTLATSSNSDFVI